MSYLKYKKRIVVKKSNIKNAGLGVFANMFLEKGTFLGYYKGKVYQADNLTDKELDFLDESAYVMAIYGDKGDDEQITKYVDSSDTNKHVSNWTRYINGAKYKKDKPNVQFTQKISRMHIETLRDIEKGEELIADYGPGYIW